MIIFNNKSLIKTDIMKSKINLILTSFLVVFLTIGISSSFAQDSKDEKKEKNLAKQRKSFDQNRSNAIKEMHKAYPESKAHMAKSYAYAAFANTGVNLFVLASGNGGGKAHNNSHSPVDCDLSRCNRPGNGTKLQRYRYHQTGIPL